jgi:hypothetical protein
MDGLCTIRRNTTSSPALILACSLLAAVPATASAQGATDLFLVRLGQTSERMTVDTVIRLTNRAGYDNQPHFSADGNAVFHTSIDSAGQADIYRINLDRLQRTNLTRTAPESEYSATVMPAGDRFSVIRVEADSTQRLWSFRLDGTDPRLVLPSARPVGYHAWIDANRVAIFVLGNPASLQLADVQRDSATVIAGNIGRSLQPVPGRPAVSFVQRGGEPADAIRIYDASTGQQSFVVAAVPGNEYHAWLPNRVLVSGRGSVLVKFTPGRDRDWVDVADLAPYGVSGISRLAVSRDGRSIVVVAEH